jgi:hypothetical protein
MTDLQGRINPQVPTLSPALTAATALKNSTTYDLALTNATALLPLLSGIKDETIHAAVQQQLLALQLQANNLKLAALWGTGKGSSGKKASDLLDPLLVRQALSRLVLIGNQIQFGSGSITALPRVGVTPPPTIDMSNLPTLQATGNAIPVTLHGDNLQGATVTVTAASTDVSIDSVKVDANGKTVSFNITIKSTFQGTQVNVNISTPAPGISTVTVPLTVKKPA